MDILPKDVFHQEILRILDIFDIINLIRCNKYYSQLCKNYQINSSNWISKCCFERPSSILISNCYLYPTSSYRIPRVHSFGIMEKMRKLFVDDSIFEQSMLNLSTLLLDRKFKRSIVLTGNKVLQYFLITLLERCFSHNHDFYTYKRGGYTYEYNKHLCLVIYEKPLPVMECTGNDSLFFPYPIRPENANHTVLCGCEYIDSSELIQIPLLDKNNNFGNSLVSDYDVIAFTQILFHYLEIYLEQKFKDL